MNTPEPTTQPSLDHPFNSSSSTLADTPTVHGQVIKDGNDLWYEIRDVDQMDPFLMTMASDSDHWLFLLSNGGLTAGRVNPDKALLPYYTQDKLQDMSGSSGSTTLLRVTREDGTTAIWQPFSTEADWNDQLRRTIRKNLLGNHIVLEEKNEELNLNFRLSWRPSEAFGFIRKVEIQNLGDEPVQIKVLDGLRNLLPPNLGQRFQNEFSNLGDAYKQTDLTQPENMGVYHLSSVPTDQSDPQESLLASVAWQIGLTGATFLISGSQFDKFRRTGEVVAESAIRGKRGAYLTVSEMSIPAKSSKLWYICADVELDAPRIEALREKLAGDSDLVSQIEADCLKTESRMKQMLAGSDGLQQTADSRQSMRHTSNTLFNLMRGGSFITGYTLPVDDVLATVKNFNKEAAKELEATLNGQSDLNCYMPWDKEHPICKGNSNALRLLREYLPLCFSRRHGDPSRPWNRFSIEIKEANGSPRFYYQGNWRDIFQNWEALLYAYPEYAEAAICRFLNASTADGYNPYKVTKDGFDWEILEPNDPWANIGYWGDHQIIYLLRLLETSIKFHPGRLKDLLCEETFVYAEVPYRIRGFDDILKNPRETVDYDSEADERIASRVKAIGADGKLMHTRQGDMVYISLLEKLLNPLLSKLSNFIPGGGIWMNTQRPEWNDANNALVGNGISVVTLGYVARYLNFLIKEFGSSLEGNSFELSAELAELLNAQLEVFAEAPADYAPEQRLDIMQRLGQPASLFRQMLYENGLSGTKVAVKGTTIIDFLKNALEHANNCLLENRRTDSLWHSYNLLKQVPKGTDIGRLFVMLEGQVSILSSGLLGVDEVLQLLESLRQSPLYREDQNSYILYPDRNMPTFLKKNRIPEEQIKAIPLLEEMLKSGDQRIVSKLQNSEATFNGSFRNVNYLKTALAEVSEEDYPGIGVGASTQSILDLFENAFNHHAFTGRSGTFFAYEGLGSIYWHMVSKLALAVQENYLDFKNSGTPEQVAELLTWYRQIKDGLGVNKNPALYGAFPTDAYSHTPAHAGAQQPGMTGQVKEDVLTRLNELGVSLDHGLVTFQPDMLEKEEFLQEATSFNFITIDGSETTLSLNPGSLAFSFCQVPVVYRSGKPANKINLYLKDGSNTELDGLTLTEELSNELFMRTEKIVRIEVDLA